MALMRFHPRSLLTGARRIPLRLLGYCAGLVAITALAPAQESTGGTGGSSAGSSTGSGSTGSSSTGGSKGSGTGTPGSMLSDSPFTDTGASSSFGTPSKPGSGEMKPAFRTGAPGAEPATTPGAAPGGTGPKPEGAASAFGEEGTQAALPPRTAPATFSVPGLYGQGPQQFVAGEGRLARPRFRFTGNVAVGYDDNVFQTPTNPPSVPDQKVQVLVSPGTPDTTETVVVPSGDPLVPNGTRTVTVPGSKPKFRTVTIPGVPAQQRIGSWVTRTDLGWDIQFASRRTLFTFDLQAGVDYYWDRPGKKADYNGVLSLIYLRKLTSRSQFTISADATYQDSQPNFAQVNAPTTNNQGAYIYANAKADLSYRLTPRLSTVTSLSYNTTLYQEKSQQGNDYAQTTFGTELRYLFSPRLTLLGDLRYSSTSNNDNPEQDVNTYYLLGGFELTLTRRFIATLRIGETVQTFKESGQSASSPYLEGTLSYQLARGTMLRWNARYGYEQTSQADSTLTVARTGLVLSQVFTPRLQGSLSLYALRSETSTTAGISSADDGSQTGTITTETVQDTIDASLSLYYMLSRRWALTLNYSYTMVFGDEESQDYYRQRVFLGAQYQF